MLELEGQENDKRVSVQLMSTESAILAAASRIYAAYISNGSVEPGQEGAFMQAAIKQAAKMSVVVDDFIKAEDEL
ncbi:hypothetical protein NO559_02570 [Dasania sp. GY-MA-18]|uniref:Uncharacterized protein n=1 Tax=Dasania phycosphaerae TaxID=2950436 RepID=A0A9J6RI77_9GAMM|nr:MULTISPECIES: hypothetical protein [Dasania]MCR8921638.1 hypothetical protein [Dasania sp. GY-MA-18]MCZ0864066.1 hypothetical protein [Dasania phycosphaerae]MCZ0867794.1 hypothetical protein [Dasania phycosphaerae]